MLGSNEIASVSERAAASTHDNAKSGTDKAGSGTILETSNGILYQVSDECRSEILARSTRVELNKRQVLVERNVPLRFAYFIEGGAVSAFARAGANRANVEIRTLGVDDFVGIPVVLGARLSPHRFAVQVAGTALRMEAHDLLEMLEEFPELRQVLLAYVHAALIHSSQLVACNTRHTLRERLARWLLVTSDRLRMNNIPLTHDALSRAIAVRRAGITTEIGRMEQVGLIRRHRGCISIIDRDGLENASCSCYRVLRGSVRSWQPVASWGKDVKQMTCELAS